MKKYKMKKYIIAAVMLALYSCVFCAQSTMPPVTEPEGRTFTVVIDPAHGGGEWGVYVKGVHEKDINLKVALLLKKKLDSTPQGAVTALLTRDKDTYMSVTDRAAAANAASADLYITIHCDYTEASSAEGFRVYYNLPSVERPARAGMELWETAHNASHHDSVRLASVITQYMSAALLPENMTAAGSEENDLLPFSARPQEGVRSHTLKGVSAPACEIVLGNLYSRSDFENLKDQQVLDRIAYHIKEGILNFLKTDARDGEKNVKTQ